MSDQSPPPKPKPGSLRDRIAAFEKSGASQAPAPPPPRPKPGGATWKPKVPSPPSSPRSNIDNDKKPGGMSATDAKESIGRGGSLKERMAALQGRGGFGAPAPPVAPKPLEKPKWKPPPVVSPPVDDEPSETPARKSVDVPSAEATGETPDPPTSPPVASGTEGEAQADKPDEDEAHKEDADPEEEERQRRAAIAARMARLGGARVGMGMPVFGKPVPAKKPSLPPQDMPAEEPKKSEEHEVSPPVTDPTSAPVSSPPETQLTTEPDGSAPKDSVSADEATSPEIVALPPPRAPVSMPVPAAPRRAAPPRRKAAKSPAPPEEPTPPTSAADSSEVSEKVEQPTTVASSETLAVPEQHEPELIQEPVPEPDKLPTPPSPTPASLPEEVVVAEVSVEKDTTPSPSDQAQDEVASAALVDAAPSQDDTPATPASDKVPDVPKTVTPVVEKAESSPTEEIRPSPASLPEAKDEDPKLVLTVETTETPDTEEEDETARRARVAARLAKMGAVNPFAPPPQRRDSDLTSPVHAPDPLKESKEPEAPHVEPPSPQPVETSITASIPEAKTADDDDVHSKNDDETKEISDVTESRARPDKRESVKEIPKPSGDRIELSEPDHPDTTQTEESQPPVVDVASSDEDEVNEAPPPPPPPRHSRQSLPPPRRVLQEEPSEEPANVEDVVEPPAVVPPPTQHPVHPHRAIPSVPPPSEPTRLPPRPVDDDDEPIEPSEPTRYVPLRTASSSSDQPTEYSRDSVVPHPTRSLPPLRSPQVRLMNDEPQTPLSQPDDEALPTIPRFSPPSLDDDVQVRSASPPESKRSEEQQEEQEEEEIEEETISPVPPPRSFRMPELTTVTNREVLDESEGDPIDPTFHSPISPKSSQVNLRLEASHDAPSPPVPAPVDEEQQRRQTIAERMAKLGGVRVGGPPLMRKPPVPAPEYHETVAAEDERHEEVPPEEPEEEDEQARRQRILARLAGGGGMRLGMIPPVAQGHQTHSSSASKQPEELPVPPPHRIQHAARSPPPVETDSEHESSTFSDDGVKVEAEESELEEVSHEDADVPPPVPVRMGRHPSIDSTNTVRSIPQASRPPIPKVNLSARRTSGDSEHQIRHVPPPPQSDYVMVEESTSEPEEVPPPPPPRPMSRPPAPPSRHVPPPPPATEGTDLSASQWELPSIPSTSIEFRTEEPDLTLSNWSEDSAAFAEPPPVPPHTARSESHFPQHEDRPRTSDELIAVWGRVGVQICEVATTLFESSKRALIGDGTYPGFVNAVLNEVPNAAPSRAPFDYGIVIYMQTGNAVQKRLADIMPGDILFLDDVKLKGHKGLQTYHQNAGQGEPLVGVVSDFEAKKSKVRVFQANQHVGQQTVESASYRLEDVKSGVIKVFRVLEV
ncbi:hypothetical protein ONZ45_g2368 [Pleurotus djamor]|nr:hypothetical protein ONZ45_g2368 [Pleurotus djamor]